MNRAVFGMRRTKESQRCYLGVLMIWHAKKRKNFPELLGKRLFLSRPISSVFSLIFIREWILSWIPLIYHLLSHSESLYQ